MLFHRSVPALVLLSLLSACATPPAPNTAQLTIDKEILEAGSRIESAQVELFQAAALNQPTVKLPVSLENDTQGVTVAWHGDALQLLSTLARQRGLAFSFVGLRLPIPVNVDVKNMPFDSVMQLVRSQVGYRADITQYPDKLVVQYNKPR